MCDFQYLPMEKERVEGDGEGRLVSIYDQVNIDRLVTTSWLNTPAPLFIPPAVFSRMDVPQDYQVPCPANLFLLLKNKFIVILILMAGSL
jgi:hypothetical protein